MVAGYVFSQATCSLYASDWLANSCYLFTRSTWEVYCPWILLFRQVTIQYIYYYKTVKNLQYFQDIYGKIQYIFQLFPIISSRCWQKQCLDWIIWKMRSDCKVNHWSDQIFITPVWVNKEGNPIWGRWMVNNRSHLSPHSWTDCVGLDWISGGVRYRGPYGSNKKEGNAIWGGLKIGVTIGGRKGWLFRNEDQTFEFATIFNIG